MIKTCATLNYSETLVTVGCHSYWKLHCFPHHDWLAACILGILWHLVVLHSCQAYLLSTWGRSLVRSFTGNACEACFATMKMSIRKCLSCYFIMFFFWCRIQQFPSQSSQSPALPWLLGPTSLLWWFVDFWLYFYIYFLIYCVGYWVVYVSKFGLVFLKWSYFECYTWIKALKCMRFIFPQSNYWRYCKQQCV